MRKKESNEVANALVLIVQIGVTMLVPILLCAIGGAWLDHKLGTRWISVLGFILGAIAGFQNVYRLVKKYLKDTKSPGQLQREKEEQEQLPLQNIGDSFKKIIIVKDGPTHYNESGILILNLFDFLLKENSLEC